MEEDERAQREGICGVTKIGATGINWICVRKVHDKEYRRRHGRRSGERIEDNNPAVDQHYFVRRWRNR